MEGKGVKGGKKKEKKRTKSEASPDSVVAANHPEKRTQNMSQPDPYTLTQMQPVNLGCYGQQSVGSNMNNMANVNPMGISNFPPQQQFQGLPMSPQQNGFEMVMHKLENMDKRLQKLDSIETQITSINKTVSSLDSRMTLMESTIAETNSKIVELEVSRNYDSQTCDEVRTTQNRILKELSTLESLKRDNARLSEELIDMQGRSMRDNLLFFNFDEAATEQLRHDENCIGKILDVCETKLGMADAKHRVKIDRAHRIGRFVAGKRRPIVAKFNYFQDKQEIKQHVREKSGDTDLRVGDQYPKIIQARRKILIPELIKAKEAGKRAVLAYDKLYIEGRLFHPDLSHRGVHDTPMDQSHPRPSGQANVH